MKTSFQNQLVVTDIPTLFWLFLLCCFFEQKARKVKGEVVTPPLVVLFVIPRLASCFTFCPSAPSPLALSLLPLLPSKTWVLGWGLLLLLLWLFFLFVCFVSCLNSADWLLITPPYLMRGNDSVFFSPQLKHYRQTHSFIIWGGAAFLSSYTCRDSVFCNAAMPLKRCFAIFWDRRSHRYQNDFGISSATVGNIIKFYSNKRKIGVSYRLYFSTLLVVQVYLWAVFDYDDYTQYFYALCHGFCLYLS